MTTEVPRPRTPALPAALEAISSRQREAVGSRGRGLLSLILLAALAWALLQVQWSDGLFRTGGLSVMRDLVAGLLSPNLSADIVSRAVEAAWLTVVYAVAGLSLALLAGLPLGIVAAGVLVRDPARRRASVTLGRSLLAAMRSVHELVWAWLFVAAIGLSPFAAIFALAIPYAGILGRIYADLLVDLPEAPLQSLRASGARESEVLLYGRLPMALPDMVSYAFYRFECALRASAIMGFVGLGGLGFEIQLALDDIAYSDVSTYLIALIVLIAGVEAWSALVRRELVE